MQKVIIYSSATCPYCINAKNLLQEKGLDYTEIRIDLDEGERDRMVELTGRTSVPQIFIDDKHIGGFDDLYAYFKNKE